jgi:hypothetical protein
VRRGGNRFSGKTSSLTKYLESQSIQFETIPLCRPFDLRQCHHFGCLLSVPSVDFAREEVMAHSSMEGISKAAAESGMAGMMQFGRERTEAMLAVQKQLLDGYEEASRAWIARVKSEVELWSELAAKLSASASIPEGMEAYRECVSHRMQMAAEDGKRLFEEGQKIIGTLTKSFGNGLSPKHK